MPSADAHPTSGLSSPGGASDPHARARRWWTITIGTISAAAFAEAVFAGSMLSGAEWARDAHRVSAVALTCATLIAGLIAIVSLRKVANGRTFGAVLLILGATILLQTAFGRLAAQGANLLWVHVPLGVAIVGIAMKAIAQASQVGICGGRR